VLPPADRMFEKPALRHTRDHCSGLNGQFRSNFEVGTGTELNISVQFLDLNWSKIEGNYFIIGVIKPKTGVYPIQCRFNI
jgi:hypothetical protein